MSFYYFYFFCLSKDFGLNILIERVLFLKEKVVRWFLVLRKGCFKRYWEKMEEDFYFLIFLE